MKHNLIALFATVCLCNPSAGAEPTFVDPDTVLASSWSAKWIGADSDASAPAARKANLWSCYRKEFTLDAKPKSAVARIAVDSKYWLWVNGTMVVREGGLKRGPTPTDTYVDEVDLAAHLKQGANTIAILVWYFGKEGFSHKSSGKSGLLFELAADQVKIVSDSSWRAVAHPSFGDTDGSQPNFRLAESNIRFDAAKDHMGWELPGFSTSSWGQANELGAPDCAPWNRLVKRPVPLWKDYGLKPYVNASSLPKVSDGKTIKAKLPYNAHVTPYLKVSAKAGEVIKIQMDNYRGGGEFNVRAEYVTREGEQAFECFGWMNGHEVHYDIPAGITILDLKFRETGFDTEFAGSFTCDDDFLNRLRTKSLRTLYVTMRDTYMDCPDRERALWWGDAVNELGEAFYAFDRRSDLLTRKCILNLIAWQKPDGVLFSPVPAGNWNKDLPMQMLASIGQPGFWTYSFYSGDMETLKAVYPGMKRYMEIWTMKENGLVVPRPGAWAWGDWGRNVDMGVLYDAWYFIGLQGLRNAAVTLKHESDLPWIDARMKSIEAAFNKTYWNGSEYRSPDHKGQTDDRANALAVVTGLAKPDQYPALIEVFDKQSHASPYMEKYVLEALCLMDRPELAQERIRKRYARMVDHPDCTTLWELFDGGTINHAWSGGPLTIMSQYFAGIAPTAAGFSSYSVMPQMGSLKKIETEVVTTKGDIALKLSDAGDLFSLDLTSPDGTQATVGIPLRAGETLTEVAVNGKTVWKTGKAAGSGTGVRFKEATSRYLVFDVKPGTWSFNARKTGKP
jgi:alpha-L-rhamnosidase